MKVYNFSLQNAKNLTLENNQTQFMQARVINAENETVTFKIEHGKKARFLLHG